MSNRRYSWEKTKEIQKVAGVETSRFSIKLSDDDANWSQEVIDSLGTKFPFLAEMPMSVRVDKSDAETRSALLFMVVQLAQGVKVSIPVMIKGGMLLPFFVMFYEGAAMPITSASVNSILSGAPLGVVVDGPKENSQSPWQHMFEGLTELQTNKMASVYAGMIKGGSPLMEVPGIRKMLGHTSSEPVLQRVKTAFYNADTETYTEYVDGKVTTKQSCADGDIPKITLEKFADDIVESISSGESSIVHEVVKDPAVAKTMKIYGDNRAQMKSGVTYDVIGENGSFPAIYIGDYTDIYLSDTSQPVEVSQNPPIALSAEQKEKEIEEKENKYDGYPGIFYGGEDGASPKYFLAHYKRGGGVVSERKIELPPEKNITQDDVGKLVVIRPLYGVDKSYAPYECKGKLTGYVEGEGEIYYTFVREASSLYRNKYTIVYNKNFKSNDYDRICTPLSGLAFNVETKDDEMKKLAEDVTGDVFVRLERLADDGKYHLSISDQRSSKEFSFDPHNGEFSASDASDVEDYDGDADIGQIKHELLRRGITKEQADEMISLADKEVSAERSFSVDSDDSPGEEEVKTASLIVKSLVKNIPVGMLEKLSGIDGGIDGALSSIFTISYVTPENINVFFDSFDVYKGIVDWLCRYYILKVTGMDSGEDKVDIGTLESLIRNLQNVILDISTYREAYNGDR